MTHTPPEVPASLPDGLRAADSDRKVSVPLAIGIAFLPGLFVWFLLRAGHSTRARAVGFGWAGFLVLLSTTLVSRVPNPALQPVAQSAASPAAPTPSPIAMSKAVRLAAMDAKISEVVLIPLDGKYDPDGYAKLGKRVWGVSNDLRRWVAYAALQSDGCDYVSAVAVSEEATQSQLSWHVVCGDKRFIISEAQARSMRTQFDPNASAADQAKAAASFAKSEPFDETPTSTGGTVALSQQAAIDACQRAVLSSANHPSTVEFPLFDFDYKDRGNGRVQLLMSASAKNSFGLQLTYDVECQFIGSRLDKFLMSEAGQ
jgi:hypothetical protein